MLLLNTNYYANHEVEMIKLVSGTTIQSKNVVSDFGQGLKTIVGGELKSYTDMMNKARAIAVERMIEEAEKLGADIILDVQFSSSAVTAAAAEILVYGTAAKIIK